jgi:hypothetical protein
MLSFGSGGNLKKVETEYIAFNKKFFQVLTSDETRLLSFDPADPREDPVLEGKFKGQFYMAFIGNELFIAVNDSNTSI